MTASRVVPDVLPGGTRQTMLDRLGPLLAEATRRTAPTLVSATIAAPTVDAVALHAAAPESMAMLWPEQDEAMIGLGEAWTTVARGPSRFDDVSCAWRALLASALVDDRGGPRGVGPILMGGFAFADDPARSPVWSGFDAASFTLPALTLVSRPGGDWLTASLVVEPDGSAHDLAALLVARWDALVRAARDITADPPPGEVLHVVERRPEATRWHDSVARLAGAVGRGRLDKAVLSRRVELRAPGPIDVSAALRRLRRSASDSTSFAIPRPGATFLGASPERLVSLAGRQLRTMAMAGSAPRSADAASDDALAGALLESDKEREEHDVVVRMLRASVGPLVEELHLPERPTVSRFRHVQHLVTPISGQLRDPGDILALVGRLHPTPAVAGTPTRLALELIADEELDDRGWYAGPVGWVDRHGDGEFVVALRSGLVRGDTATLFAGCGIVADSDPEREWQESATKLLALGSALGRIEP